MRFNHQTITFFLNRSSPSLRLSFPALSLLSISNQKDRVFVLQLAFISSLKVHWRRDTKLDQAILNDRKWRICARVVREVLNEPGHSIPLGYLEKRRERLRLMVKAKTFLDQNPNLFETYLDRIRPKSELVPFIRPSGRLCQFMEDERRIYERNEEFLVAKLCKLLMMSKHKVISTDKLAHVKREFGFPNDFLRNLVPKNTRYFKIVGRIEEEGKSFLELVSWEPEFAQSVIMKRVEEEEKLTGIRVRPSFNWELPPRFVIKKEMREWVRDWMEMPYISPYEDSSRLDESSREMEKRMVGVLHELLSLSLFKRIPVPVLGKFGEEYKLSNAFTNAFSRHPGIFYLSLKGGIKTAMLREAYRGDVLIDRDPLLEIKDKFVEMLEEGWKERAEKSRLQQVFCEEDTELLGDKDEELDCQDSEEELDDEIT